MKYIHKPMIVEAITFDELVKYGKSNGANIVNDMPWSFTYNGLPVTHENDECYLILTRVASKGTLRFTPNDMLITQGSNDAKVCRKEEFHREYDKFY